MTERETNKKNINWINIIKAICMILVYFIHTQSYCDYRLEDLNYYIYPIYVNAFFFVSGYLLFRKQLSSPIIDEGRSRYLSEGGKTLFLNMFSRIVIPSIIFSIIEFFPKKLIRGQAISNYEFIEETICGGTYWFTSALVIAQLLILIALFFRNRSIYTYWINSIILMFIGLYLINNNFFVNFWYFNNGLLAVAFLTAGGIYWKYEQTINRVMRKWVLLLSVLSYMCIFTFFNQEIKVLLSIPQLNIAGYIISCVSSVMLIELCKLISEKRTLTFIGKNSLAFYFMSGAIPNVLSIISIKLLGESSWYMVIAVWILSVIIAYYATIFLNRFLPFLFDIRILFPSTFKK